MNKYSSRDVKFQASLFGVILVITFATSILLSFIIGKTALIPANQVQAATYIIDGVAAGVGGYYGYQLVEKEIMKQKINEKNRYFYIPAIIGLVSAYIVSKPPLSGFIGNNMYLRMAASAIPPAAAMASTWVFTTSL